MTDYPTFFELAINQALVNGSYARQLTTMSRAQRLLSDWDLSNKENKFGVTAALSKTCVIFTSN